MLVSDFISGKQGIDNAVYPLKFQVIDEINNTSLYTYEASENPLLFSEFKYTGNPAVNTRTLWGTLKYDNINSLRTFDLNFTNIPTAQKTALETIYGYHAMMRFYYMGRHSLTDYANTFWMGGFNAQRIGPYYNISFQLQEVGY